MVASDGGVFNYGDAGFFGSASTLKLTQPVVGIAATPDGKGYWLVSADGGVYPFGTALRMDLPPSQVEPARGRYHRDARWQGLLAFAADGGIFNYGDAQFLGSAAARS